MYYKPYFPYYRRKQEPNQANKEDDASVKEKKTELPAEAKFLDGAAGDLKQVAGGGKMDPGQEKVNAEAAAPAKENPSHREDSGQPEYGAGRAGMEEEHKEAGKTWSIDQGEFEQLGPGVFRFKKGRKLEPAVYPVFPGAEPEEKTLPVQHTAKGDNFEAGFVRLDTLPGLYSKYSTPVYQFT